MVRHKKEVCVNLVKGTVRSIHVIHLGLNYQVVTVLILDEIIGSINLVEFDICKSN